MATMKAKNPNSIAYHCEDDAGSADNLTVLAFEESHLHILGCGDPGRQCQYAVMNGPDRGRRSGPWSHGR